MNIIILIPLGILSTLAFIRLFVLCVEEKKTPEVLLINGLASLYGLMGIWTLGIHSAEIQRFFISILLR